MFLWLGAAALFLTLFYFYVNRREKDDQPIQEEIKLEKFIASNTFAGGKPGYIFKNDELGIGYYLDYK